MKALRIIMLAALTFGSALWVVVNQHDVRKTFAELQELELQRDALEVEWGKLQLEQSTWSTHDRIENVARSELNMHEPSTASLILIRQ